MDPDLASEPAAAPQSAEDAPAPRARRWPSPTSPVMLIVTLAAAIAVAAVQDSTAHAVLRGLLVLVLVPCALIDLDRRIIPNRITGPAAVVAIVAGLAVDPAGEPKRLLWGALAGGFLFVTALVNPAGMGMGDVKLLAVMGLFLGPAVIIALLFALLGNVLAAVVIAARHGMRVARKAELPFGPYLALGGLIAALVGDSLVRSWLHLHP